MRTQFNFYARLLAGVVLLASFAGMNRLNAQATGSIVGTVTDMSGAAVPGASVQVKNSGTGVTQTTTADAQGRYRVPELIIGTYDLQAAKAGFSTVNRPGVTLTVGAEPVVDFALPVGQQTQTVTVSGEVSQVETQSTAVGALVEGKQISEIPLNGRNFTSLLTLAPGVTQIPLGNAGAGSTFYGNGVKYSIAGGRPSGQAYLMDDQDMVNFWNNGPGAGGLGTALGVEAIAEFQTLTNTYSTQYGGAGAVINASSKSGTNGFHGSVYEFIRNDKLEDRNFFDLQSGATPYKQNQFGGSLGGPIKKDKLFFFGNYEGFWKSQTLTAIATVPDACAHQFLASTAAPGVCGAAITQNANPQIAAAIQNTMALYPLPNYNPELFTGGNPSETGQAATLEPVRGHENYVIGRVDYNVTDKDSLFVRYIADYATRVAYNVSNVPLWPETDLTRDNFISLEERRVISPTLVNLLHFGFSRTYESANVTGSPTVANGVATPGTITSSGLHPLQFFGTSAGREDGNIATFSGVSAIGGSTTLPFYLIPNKFQYGDDVIWTHGAHSIKAGMTATQLRENTWAPFEVGGVWTFTNIGTFLAGTPAQVVTQLSDQQYPQSDATKDYRYWVFAPYIDDQWKLTKKLTMNIGLRYSPETMIGSVRHVELQLLNPPYGTSWTPTTNSTATNPSLKNFDPRIGLAFDPFSDHKTSIRAGFGIFHSVIYSRDLNLWLQPPFIIATQVGAPFLGTCAASCSPVTTPITPGTIPTNGLVNPPNSNYYYVNNTPYIIQYNFNIQREIAPNTVATVGYVGSHATHLFMQLDFNPPTPNTVVNGVGQGFCTPNAATPPACVTNPRLNPEWGALIFANTIGSSNYNGLQASLNRRFSHNWQFQASYVYSKSIDDTSGTYGLDGGGLGAAATNPTCLSCDKGLSNFDRRNNLRLSGIYTAPNFAKSLVGQLVNGWEVTGSYTYLSGAPLTPISTANRVFTGSGSPTGRPNEVAGCDLYPAQQTINQWYNTSCFSIQQAGTYGNAGRYTIIGPNLWGMDGSLSKNWSVPKISEQFRIQFRAEAFNLLNHPTFQNPNNTVFAGAIPGANPLAPQLPGVGVNASAGRITAVNSQPRQIQLGLKIIF
jgi:hypothetical protein